MSSRATLLILVCFNLSYLPHLTKTTLSRIKVHSSRTYKHVPSCQWWSNHLVTGMFLCVASDNASCVRYWKYWPSSSNFAEWVRSSFSMAQPSIWSFKFLSLGNLKVQLVQFFSIYKQHGTALHKFSWLIANTTMSQCHMVDNFL
jgi:hypothetical protein